MPPRNAVASAASPRAATHSVPHAHSNAVFRGPPASRSISNLLFLLVPLSISFRKVTDALDAGASQSFVIRCTVYACSEVGYCWTLVEAAINFSLSDKTKNIDSRVIAHTLLGHCNP